MSDAAISSWSSSTRSWSPPRFTARFRRAFSTRMRRMASAAAAKKWPRLFQSWAVRALDQPQVRLVDEGRRLERLPRLLLRQPLGGQFAQLVVDQRQQLLGGLRVALLDRREDSRDVVHRREAAGDEDAPAATASTRAPSLIAAARPWIA